MTNKMMPSKCSPGRLADQVLGGGAGVVISATPPPTLAEPDFYPDPQYVVIQHAKKLSWLFIKLRDAFSGVIDHYSRFQFYGRLADAADRYANAMPPESPTVEGLLVAVLDEARSIARGLQSSTEASTP
jgi:hypothetical protein